MKRVEHGWSVELGDGCYDGFLNADLLWIARRLYSLTSSVSPVDIFNRIMSGEEVNIASAPLPVLGGDVYDWRYCTLADCHRPPPFRAPGTNHGLVKSQLDPTLAFILNTSS